MNRETEIDLNQFVPKVQFELIPIKNLVSNQDYQRNLSIKHVQKVASHFDLQQINPVKVSRRNGINYVFNGQHTIEIIALVSGSRETPVWCMVYDDLVYEEEADMDCLASLRSSSTSSPATRSHSPFLNAQISTFGFA